MFFLAKELENTSTNNIGTNVVFQNFIESVFKKNRKDIEKIYNQEKDKIYLLADELENIQKKE